MRLPRQLTRDEAQALQALTKIWQSPDDLGVSHLTVHSLFLLGLAERNPVRVGRRWENHYRATSPRTAR
jgi:hypothetical protein